MCGIVGVIEHSHAAESPCEDNRWASIHPGQRLAHGAWHVWDRRCEPTDTTAHASSSTPPRCQPWQIVDRCAHVRRDAVASQSWVSYLNEMLRRTR
jgi:hypothetical protein